MRDDWEYSLLTEGEERNFDNQKGDPITINWIMEQHENDSIFMANLDFQKIKLTFNIDTLYVQYPKKIDLKKDLSDVLKVIGYFAADEILDFAQNNPGNHNISGLFGRNSKEISAIDFDDIIHATLNLKEQFKDIK